MISSHIGDSKLHEQQYLAGELELELSPQGTRPNVSAPAGRHPGLLYAHWRDTMVAEDKPCEMFEGEKYIRETWLRADFSIVKYWRADTAGADVERDRQPQRRAARHFCTHLKDCRQ